MYIYKVGKNYHLEYRDESVGHNRRISTRTAKRSEALKFVNEFKKEFYQKQQPPIKTLLEFSKEYQNYVAINFSSDYAKTVDLPPKKCSSLLT